MSTDALWYLARGAGTVSLVLLTVVMVLGIGSRSGRPVFGLPRFGVVAVHRNASLVAVGLLIVHLLTLLLDPYAQLRLVNLVIPFGSVYRPLWVGLGTVAIDLLVVVLLSTWVRHYLGARTWRAVHWAAYAIWPIALLHGLFSGTDGGRSWLLAIAGLCALAVAAALVWRLSDRFTETARLRAAVTPGTAAPHGNRSR
jgi:sulfoxide reductase heme-binding subunit YedZ